MLQVFSKLLTNQKGSVHAVPLLVIVSIVGVISFLLLSSFAPFNDDYFSTLFPREEIMAATGFPPNFTEQQIVSGITNGTAMEFAPDGRLFILEQQGQLRVYKNGGLLPTPFISLSVDSNSERGLLGIAFDPNFTQNHYLYLYYTTPANVHNRVSRFTANGDVAASGSEVVLMDFDAHSAGNHNGGSIHFGTDGKLYIATGDDAFGGNAQTLTTDHGKLLRINPVPDDPVTASVDERIPSDNPTSFTTLRSGTFRTESPAGKYRSFWAIGLRNPFTFAVQPGSGKIHINDVGDNFAQRWEEINLLSKGANFGWPEAFGIQGTQDSRLTRPLYTYQPEGCAITGGTFYNPTTNNFPANYVGKYFFSDYCGGWLKILDPANNSVTTFATNVSFPVDLKVGPDGALYYLARGSNAVFRITFNGVVPTPTPSPTPAATPQNQAPTAAISTPLTGTMYSAGTTINFSGTGTDPEDGNLAGSAFTWVVQRHHNDGIAHTHPVLGPVSGTSGSFIVPTQDEKSVNVFYRISLTVKDSQNRNSATVTRDIQPRTVNLTLNSNPAGGQLFLDGIGVTSPHTFGSIIGLQREISAPATRTVTGQTYNFSSWSDSGAITHNINTPSANTTYTASYILNCPLGLLGDTDCNGKIDIFDFNNVVTDFAKTGQGLLGDVDNDLDVDIHDFNAVVTNFGSTG